MININKIIKSNKLDHSAPFDIDKLISLSGIKVEKNIIYKKNVFAESLGDSKIVISSLFIDDSLSLYITAYVLYFAINNIKTEVSLEDLKINPLSCPERYRANTFALSLLLQKKAIFSESKKIIDNQKTFFGFKKKKNKYEFIEELAEIFCIDHDRMKRRLIQIDIIKK